MSQGKQRDKLPTTFTDSVGVRRENLQVRQGESGLGITDLPLLYKANVSWHCHGSGGIGGGSRRMSWVAGNVVGNQCGQVTRKEIKSCRKQRETAARPYE